MKKFLLISILFFLSAFSIIAQSPCPTISITPPNGLTAIGGSMTFTAKVDGISLENLKYQWTVSNGEITSGQGTQKINIATTEDMGGQSVTATVEISGLPQNCSSRVSNSGEIVPEPISHPYTKFDEYEKVSWSEEKTKLDYIGDTIGQDKEIYVFFRFQITAKKYLQIAKIRSNKIEKYLIEKHKISKDRIKIRLEIGLNNMTEIYFVFSRIHTPLPF